MADSPSKSRRLSLAACALAAVALLFAAPRSRAQSADSPPIRVNVRQVLVPVIVTDRKGHHVTGLKESDFHIEEDGVQQEISAFSADTASSATALFASSTGASGVEPTSGRAPGAASLGHTFVICIDTLHTALGDSSRAREALMQLFEKERPAGAQFVIVGIGRKLQVLRTATSDPAAVLAALRNPAIQPALGGADAAALKSELDDLKNRMYDFCRRCAACASRSNQHACDADIQNLKSSLDGQAERWTALDRRLLEQLESVIEEVSKLPTARTMVLISDGFSLHPESEFYAVAASFLPYDSRFRMSGAADLEPDLAKIMRSAAARNVRVYSVNSLGVQQTSFGSTGSLDASSPSDRSPQSVILRGAPASNRGGTLFSDMDRSASSLAFQNGSAMEQLARATGGIYFHDSNDMLKQFRTAIGDGRDYYLVAYTPKNPASGYHAITVTVSDSKLNVRAKAGYWAENP